MSCILVKKKSPCKPFFQKGFSLLEVMIALAVFIVLMVVTVNVVQNQRGYDYIVKNEHYMNQVKEAFMTFVKINHFLPCPDTDGDGQENRVGAECSFMRGTVPFLDLGVPATDAWNQPLLYAVNERADGPNQGVREIHLPDQSASYFNNQSAPVFDFNTLPIGQVGDGGLYRICGEMTPVVMGCSTATAPDRLFLEEFAIAVVVSFGENGSATWNAINSNGTGASIGLNEAETENMDRDQDYWQAVGSQREGQRFDDQLFWLLGTDVKYAVISSGGTL